MSTEPVWNSWPCWALESNCRLPFVISCRFVFACRSYPIPYSSDLSFNRFQCRFPLQKEKWKKKLTRTPLSFSILTYMCDVLRWKSTSNKRGKGKREKKERKGKKRLGKKKFFFQASLAGGFFVKTMAGLKAQLFFRGTLAGVRVTPRSSGFIQDEKAVTMLAD